MSDDRDGIGGLVPAMGLPASATDDLRQRLHTRLTLPGPADAAAGLQRGDDLDGARILVNGATIADAWTSGATTPTGTVELTAGVPTPGRRPMAATSG